MGARGKMLFDVETANGALPLVRAIVRDVVSDFRTLRRVSRQQRSLRATTDGSVATLERLRNLGEEVEGTTQRIEGYLGELDDLGLELRDLETGAVDFPTLVNGQPAYLSWRLGECRVGWWHAAGTGHTDRRPISEVASGALPAGS